MGAGSVKRTSYPSTWLPSTDSGQAGQALKPDAPPVFGHERQPESAALRHVAMESLAYLHI